MEALCPDHSQAAPQSCLRCGRFLCGACEISSAGWCRPCWEHEAPRRQLLKSLGNASRASLGLPLLGVAILALGPPMSFVAPLPILAGPVVAIATLVRALNENLERYAILPILGLGLYLFVFLIIFLPH